MKNPSDFLLRRRQCEEMMLSAQPLLLEGYTALPGAMAESQKALLGVSSKSSFKDLVTLYDRKVEDFIKDALRKVFPGEHIVGEETLAGMHQDPREVCKNFDSFWLVDPIDGTSNFSRSYPFFCSTVSFMVKTGPQEFEPRVAVTFDPTRTEMFSASTGGGAWLNRQQMRVSPVDRPEQALLVTGFASDRSSKTDTAYILFQELTRMTLGVRRDGSAALDLAYVAAGRLDAYWEWGLAPWDIAAGALLVQEAGGEVTAHSGGRVDFFTGEILSTNARLHKWLLNKIEERRHESARH